MIQNLQDIEDKIFFETQNILETLGKITSQEELLNKQDLVVELNDRVAFLKVLNKNRNFLKPENTTEALDNQFINPNIDKSEECDEQQFIDDDLLKEDIIEEEVKFTNEINESENYRNDEVKINNDFDLEKNNEEILATSEERKEELFEIDNESKVSEEIAISEEEILPTYEERVAQKEKEFLEMEERRRKIVEFSKHETSETPVIQERPIQQSSIEKKFKLASIKGIKAVKNLFDEDPLEKVEEEESEHQEIGAGSILKTNIATDFMEATKKRPEFRIDFNDKIAFTKLLFGGDEAELRKMIDQLNSYEHLEDARQFLSEIYYKRDWRSVDEYAQRLWTLVENKFL